MKTQPGHPQSDQSTHLLRPINVSDWINAKTGCEGHFDGSLMVKLTEEDITLLNHKHFMRLRLYLSLLVNGTFNSFAFIYMYSQTCVKRQYETRHMFGFSDRLLLIAA